MTAPKINLNAIKGGADIISANKKVEKKVPEKAPDNNKVKLDNIEAKKEIQAEAPKRNPKRTKITLSAIKQAPEKEEKKTEVKEKSGKQPDENDAIKKRFNLSKDKLIEVSSEIQASKKIKEKKPLFENYQSKFTKESGKIIKGIKKLKNIPKTRIGFVASLILLTTISIGALFYIDPETHNINNYKTSILNSFEKITGKQIQETSNSLATTGTGQKLQLVEKITVGGYMFDVNYSANEKGEKVYNYNGKEYTNIKKLRKALNRVANDIKKGKIIKYLKESYIDINMIQK